MWDPTMLVVHTFVSDDQRFELYQLKLPQRHGQNLYKQNIILTLRSWMVMLMGMMKLFQRKMRSLKLKVLVGSLTKIGPVDESYKG